MMAKVASILCLIAMCIWAWQGDVSMTILFSTLTLINVIIVLKDE